MFALLAGRVGVAQLVVVGAEVDVFQVRVGQQVPDDDQHGAADGDERSLVASSAGQSAVAGAEEGLGSPGPGDGVTEGAGQVPVAVPGGAPAFLLAGRLLDPGGEPGPGGQVRRGGEAAHVHPDLGDDRLGGGAVDPRDRVQPLHLVSKRADLGLDPGVELGDVGVEFVHPGEHLGQQERVMVGEVSR